MNWSRKGLWNFSVEVAAVHHLTPTVKYMESILRVGPIVSWYLVEDFGYPIGNPFSGIKCPSIAENVETLCTAMPNRRPAGHPLYKRTGGVSITH